MIQAPTDSALRDAKLWLESLPTHSSVSTISADTVADEKAKRTLIIPPEILQQYEILGIDVHHDGAAKWASDSRLHPRNWSLMRKCYDTGIILFLEFLMTLVSNTGSSTAEQTYISFGVSKKAALFYFTFAYLCGQAAGGLFLPPVSETFGSQVLYVVTTALFGTANLLIGAFPHPAVVVTARFCSGFFSATPGTVAAGSIQSMWDVRARIWVIHLWVVAAVIGLACGPGVATCISLSSLGWRWVYMISGLVSIIAAMFCLLMRESRPSKILRSCIQSLESRTGVNGVYAEDAAVAPSFSTFCHTSLLLPIRLFFTEPIVALTSIMAASVYAIIYMFPEALPHVYPEFGFGTIEISLANLAFLCGIPFTFLCRLIDIRLSTRRRKQGIPDEPETKLTGMIFAAPCLAISFFVFAASVPPIQKHVSPWISLACLAGIGFSTVEFDNVLSGYLTDSYSSWAASANAPMAFLRAMFSGIFPLFASEMFIAMDANRATFVLAGIATSYCVAAAWFARYGKIYREKSKFATRSACSKPLP